MNIPKTYLTENVDKNAILKILTQGNPSSTNNPQYRQLADWAGRRQSKIKNIELRSLKISDSSLIGKQLNNRYNTLGSLLNTLKNLTDSQGDNAEIATLVQQITLEILEDLKAKDEGNVQPKEEANLYEGMDWSAEKARRLTAARESGEAISEVLDKFYDDYYRTEYAGGTDEGIITKLKSLDKILIPEFNALGYNPEVNPLAQFLKILIEQKPDIFNKLNANNYGAIHNSFIDKKVTSNMLGNYDKGNILFCSDLYNKNGLDIVEYLSLQNGALSKAKSDLKGFTSKNQLIAVLFIQQKPLSDNYVQNINELKKATNILLPTANTAKVKSLLEIRELYRHLFGAVPERKVDQKDLDNIVKRVVEENIIFSTIQYLLEQDDLEAYDKVTIQVLKKWLTDIGYRTRNKKAIDKAKKILSGYSLDARNKRNLATKLQGYYDKNVRNKKADK